MSFLSRALGVHINPIKNQYSGFGNAIRDVAIAAAAYYGGAALLAHGAASAAGGAAASAGGAGAGAGGTAGLTGFGAGDLSALGGGLNSAGLTGFGAGDLSALGGGGGASSGMGFTQYARLARMMPQGGGQQSGPPPMRDWTQPAVDNIPKTQQQIVAEALAKQQGQYG